MQQQPFFAPKMSNPPKRSKTMKISDYIPGEVILQILHKLPVKSLVRFTCVSKTWLSQIKNPTFISTHLNLNLNENQLLLLLRFTTTTNQTNIRTEHYSLRCGDDNFNHYMHFHCPFQTHSHYHSPYLLLLGTINGLICLAEFITHTIIIWNPLIQKSVSLPKSSITDNNDYNVSFGFDSRSNDYKVLRLVNITRYGQNLEAEVYSLKKNSWKRIGGVPRYQIKWCERQVFVNGAVHFLAYRSLSAFKYHNLILGFEVGDEVFKEIMLPQSLVNGDPLDFNISVCNESIAVFEKYSLVPGGGGRHVWVMEEYGVVQSWTKIFSFNGLESVLGFRKNQELFMDIYAEGIVSFKAESGKIKPIGVRGGRCIPFVDYFVESMELLNNANAVSDAYVENDAIWGC